MRVWRWEDVRMLDVCTCMFVYDARDILRGCGYGWMDEYGYE